MKTFSIVGMNHRNAEAFVATLNPGVEATLVREPNNPFDPLAVAVWIDGVHVGYIPKAQNKALAAFIDQTGTDFAVPPMALDEIAQPRRGIPAVFRRSPNSGWPLVEVSE